LILSKKYLLWSCSRQKGPIIWAHALDGCKKGEITVRLSDCLTTLFQHIHLMPFSAKTKKIFWKSL
jgi:hypothetical protein